MSKRASPTVVGTFVVVALAIAVAAVIVLGGGELFRTRPRAVAYFDGSVNGLEIGAPVTWLGVRIGSVTEVRLDLDVNRRAVRIPVYMEFDPERINVVVGSVELLKIKDLVARGLRATLQQQSFITGQLYVELAMRPDTDAHLSGNGGFTVPEIPTVKSDLDTIKEAVEKLPLKDIGDGLKATLVNINNLFASPDAKKAVAELAGSTEELHAILGKLDGKGEPFPVLKEALTNLDKVQGDLATLHEVLEGKEGVGKTTNDALAAFQGTGTAAAGLLDDADKLVKTDARGLIADTRTDLRSAQTALESLNSLIAPNSPQRADLDQILRNLAYATQDLRGFSEQLDRNPSALLTGKK